MSLSINQFGANSVNYILSQSIKQNEESQASISWQLGSGTISSTIEGLGDNRQFALHLSMQMAENKAYRENVSSILNRLNLSSGGLKQLSQVAHEMYKTATEMLAVENQGDSDLSGSSSTAKSDLDSIKQALNTVDNTGGYVFSGGDARQIPIPTKGPLSDTPLAHKINDIVSDMLAGHISASDAFKQATAAASDNNQPNGTPPGYSIFDPTLSVSPAEAYQSRKNVTIGDRGETWTAGAVATEGQSTPSDTSTGSPIRDLIRNTMLISALGQHKMTDPGVLDLVKQIQQSTSQNSDELINMESATGSDQTALKNQQGALKSINTMLASYMSENISSNPAALALKSDNLRAQLQVSFTLISKMKEFSLANYI
ncbi:hypothetical protein PT277_10180 [Acetobacteraceae bacterium ESL0709]|nr:hypothetical protein [Acetobacteraceae bacterium ESL0697]MDF7679048.1 hypothetical protein [Acetobacteraceae bacterium ESL0709]